MEKRMNCHAYGCHTSFKVRGGNPTHFIDIPVERVNIKCPQCGSPACTCLETRCCVQD